jgi:protein-L-isoaspartate O-methyltransferase
VWRLAPRAQESTAQAPERPFSRILVMGACAVEPPETLVEKVLKISVVN